MGYYDRYDDKELEKDLVQFAEKLKAGGTPAAQVVQEVSGTSKIFGRDSAVTVVFQGDIAGTDGDTIFYPAIDQQAILSDEEVRIIRGYVDHEAAHIRHTDMPFFQEIAEKALRSDNLHLKDMTNAIEDVRIEREVLKTYRGAKKNLSAVGNAVTELYNKHFEEDNTIAEDPKRVASVALTWAGRIDMDYDGTVMKEAFDTLKPSLQRALKKWVREIDDCKNVQDSYQLARKIVHDLNEDKPEDEDYEQQQTGGGMPSKDPLDDVSTSDSSGSGQGKGMSSEELQKLREDVESKQNQANDPTQKGSFDPELSSFINNFENTAEPEQGNYRVMSTEFDLVHTAKDKKFKGDMDASKGYHVMGKYRSKQEYQELLLKSSGSLNVMKRKLERAVQSKYRVDWDQGREYGRLDSRRLSAAYSGRSNVFKDKVDAPALDTAVTLLIDHSGSMSGQRAQTARDVTISLGECLHKIGAEFEIAGWNNYVSFRGKEHQKKWNDMYYRSRRNYARSTPLHMYLYKAFGDSYQQNKDVLVSMPYNVAGYNCDGDALCFAGDRLAQRAEKRKIFLVLSDGQPAGDGHFGQDKTFLRNTVHRFEQKGIDLIGIGIQSKAVKQYYPKWVHCESVDDLAKNTMDMLAKALLGENFVIDNSELIAAKGQ
jgi:cobalamin biosynthesis protein CobT